MKTAFLFPGQGSQYVGMGKELRENFPAAADLFQAANDALGYDLRKICFEGTEADLMLTQNTQPAILTVSVAAHAVFVAETGLKPALVAGHSLGEYSALVSAGALAFGDALRVVHKRGKFMQEAVAPGLGAMAAFIGGTNAIVEKICGDASLQTGKVCEMANFNGGGQVVISGDRLAVEAAIKIATDTPELGVRRAVLLPVSAPFHCSLMQPAADNLLPLLESMEIEKLETNYIANVDATEYSDPKVIVQNLYKQVAKSVLWEQSMLKLSGMGITRAIEVGPGKVLSGLMRRIDKNISMSNVESLESIRAFKAN